MRFKALDGLRGIAAIMVVLYHFDIQYTPKLFYQLTILRHSYSFVDLFFVLSGFVISYNYRDLRFENLIHFAKKRFWRLYPLMIFTSSLFFIYNISSFYSTTSNHLFLINFNEILHQTVAFIDSIFLTNSFPILSTSLGSNPPSWSISAEFVAYFLFALISVSFKRKLLTYLVITILGIFLCIANHKYFTNGDFGFLRAIICFNIGSIVLFFFDKYKKLKIGFFYECTSLVIFLIYIYFVLGRFYENKFILESIFTPIVYGFMIFVFALSDGFISRLLSSKLLCYFGKLSYSIYLNHLIVVFGMAELMFNILNFENSLLNQTFYMVFSIVIILIYSSWTFNTIERKYNKYG